ncbi:MAG: DMT family transporter [Candidatus Marinimicrobia bacterium]|nr:DMT family transporter [Candidatus Neomarinimicrobiota bacterium]
MNSKYRIWFLLFIALLSVSSSAIIVRYLPELHAITIAFARMSIAGILLWTFSIYKPQGRLPFKTRILTIISGVFLGIHFAFFFSAVKMTSLANATLFGTLAPVFTIIINYLIYKNKINHKIIIGLMLSILGGFIMQGFDINFESQGFRGDLFAIICSFWMAFVLVITKKIRKSHGTLIYSRLLYFSASVTLLILIFILNIPLRVPTQQEFSFLLLLGFIPNILGHSILYYSIRYLPSSTVASIPLGEPIIVSILGLILFNEIIPVFVIIGGIIALLGLFLILQNSDIENADM